MRMIKDFADYLIEDYKIREFLKAKIYMLVFQELKSKEQQIRVKS